MLFRSLLKEKVLSNKSIVHFRKEIEIFLQEEKYEYLENIFKTTDIEEGFLPKMIVEIIREMFNTEEYKDIQSYIETAYINQDEGIKDYLDITNKAIYKHLTSPIE